MLAWILNNLPVVVIVAALCLCGLASISRAKKHKRRSRISNMSSGDHAILGDIVFDDKTQEKPEWHE